MTGGRTPEPLPPQDAGVPSDALPRALHPEGWKPPRGYAHGMTATGRVVVTAGQIGWDPATERLVSDDFAAQTAQALRNTAALLREAGARPEHLMRMTWYVTDRAAYLGARKALGAAWREVIGPHYPAMAVVVVAGLLEEGALVEIESIAVVPG